MVKCGYCGKESPDDAQVCPGCGTQLTEPPNQRTGGSQQHPATLGVLVESALAATGVLAGHPLAIVDLFQAIAKLDPEDPGSPHCLLERAALLESINLQAAVALYEVIIEKYPGTRAAEEARRNAQTLRTAHPELG
jgi:hypothetical protein